LYQKLVYDTPPRNQDGAKHMARRRRTVQQAAEELSLTVDAIRQRVRRESLESEKVDGRVYVWLVDDEYEKSKRSVEGVEMVEVLREQVEDLRSRLDREQEANRENRRIIAALTERIPEIEAPASTGQARGSSESAGDASSRGRPPQDTETAASRPWWRRWLG